MIGRFDVSEGEAPPYHTHTNEDEVFILIKGTALVWVDDQQSELGEGGIYLLEVNTQPGMTPLSLVPEQAKLKGITYGELVERLIAEALAKGTAQ
jgi:quercetin dioxygenase-like cupin family protein